MNPSFFMIWTPQSMDLLEFVKSSQHTSSSNTTENVGSSSLHQRHESLVLHDLDSAVNGSLVLDSTTGGHHHTSSDGINGVGHKSSSDGNSPSKKEGKGDIGCVSKKNWLQGVEETEVHATVDEDTDSRDGESSVQSLDTVRLQSLGVDVDETVELTLSSLTLGVIGQPGSGIVKGVDKHEGEGSSSSSGKNVGSELPGSAGVLGGGEGGLDGILEGKVKSLGWEVSEHISQVSSPEGIDTLSLEDPGGTVNDTSVWLVKTTLLDHLILVLDEELDSLDGSSSSLGDSSSNTSEHEILNESQLLLVTHYEA